MATPLVQQAAARLRQFSNYPIWDGSISVKVEGTGSAQVEVLDSGPWAGPANGARHRVLQINILSDVTRDESGLPIAEDADSRAWAEWEVLDRALNDWSHDWRAVHSSRRADGPVLSWIPDGDGSIMLSARYEISCD